MKFFATAAALVASVATVSAAPIDPNSVNTCLVQAVVNVGNDIGCLGDRSDLNAAIQCGCNKDRGDLISRGISFLSANCPDQITGETYALLDQLCAEGISGNELPPGVNWP